MTVTVVCASCGRPHPRTPDPVPDVLPPDLQAVMAHYADQVPEGWIMPFKHLAGSIGWPVARVKRAVHKLARMGLLEIGTGFDEMDGLIAGRGYGLSITAGMDWAKAHRAQASVKGPSE